MSLAAEFSPKVPAASAAAVTAAAAGVRDGLVAPREAIEGAFVIVGEQLGNSATILARLSGLFETLPGELGGEQLATATDRLAVVGQRSGEIAAALGAEQQDLSQLVAILRQAASPIDQLRRIVKMMGIVAINARVVAAGVVDDVNDFGVFTKDIAELSSSAAETIATFHRTYVTLSGVVADAAAASGRFEAEHRATLAELARQMAKRLAEVTEQRLEAMRSSAATGEMSRAISARIATSVMALQVGDATRQRVEHVEQALGDLLAAISAGETPPPYTGAVLGLQARQLAAAREALTSEMASGGEALSTLARDVGSMLEHARATYGSSDNRSALADLHQAVRSAVTVLRDCEAEREKLDGVARSVSDTVRVLLGHVEAVQEIEYKMRLVSLNAAVKCAQLGPRGRALDVIAQQLRTLTGETVVSAQQAVECLDGASRHASAFSGSAESGANSVAHLEVEATGALAQLEAVGHRMKQALVELYRDGPDVTRRLEDAVAAFDGHNGISEALSDAEFVLEEQAAALPASAMAGDGNGAAFADFHAALRRRYTMDAERRLHDQAFGAPVATSTPADAAPDLFDTAAPLEAPAPESGGDGLDDLLF